ncbi:MAG: YdjY domain-containing protein [Planctomycetota bacterium]|jgi:hypothetical protein
MNNGLARFLVVSQVFLTILVMALLFRTQTAIEKADEAIRRAEEATAAEPAAPVNTGSNAALIARLDGLEADFELLANNINTVEENLLELKEDVAYGNSGLGNGSEYAGANAPPAQPIIEYTPELRAALRKAVSEKGVTLHDDRVEIPGRIVLDRGALEFFAVFPGGKAHESVIVLLGNADESGEAPDGLAAALNSCLMAIGLAPGTPLRFLPGGRLVPAKGSTVHLYVEWEEEGATVRVGAEDFLWDREKGRSLEKGKFIYVGSYFDPEGYIPDLTGDAVACYSVPTTVIDLDDSRAASDTIFLACTPRIPAPGTDITMVFSKEPMEVTRTWDPEDLGGDLDETDDSGVGEGDEGSDPAVRPVEPDDGDGNNDEPR